MSHIHTAVGWLSARVARREEFADHARIPTGGKRRIGNREVSKIASLRLVRRYTMAVMGKRRDLGLHLHRI